MNIYVALPEVRFELIGQRCRFEIDSSVKMNLCSEITNKSARLKLYIIE
jgi:hypothetical protein